MRLSVFTRLVAAAGTVFLAAASTPAMAQATSDVAVTLTAPSASKVFSLGVARTYTIKVTNNGPGYVSSFQVDGTFTATAPYTALKIAPSGCTPVTAGTPLPCTVTLSTPLLTGGFTSVNIAVTVKTPNPLPTAAAACPSGTVGDHDLTATIGVPKIYQTQMIGSPAVATEVEITDTNTANNTITPAAVNAISPFTDLAITSFTAPANGSEGQDLLYSVTIQNNGPCISTGTFSDFYNPGTIAYVSSTGCDNAADFTKDFGPPTGVLLGCDMASADIAVGASRSYTTTWKVLTFPKSVFEATVPVSVDVFWDWDVVNGPDPSNPANSAAAGPVSTKIDLSSNKGCSTGGAGTLLALLPLLGLKLRRRRAS